MQNQFYISHAGETKGPFPLQDILSQISGGRVELTDYIYDEIKQDWVLLMEQQEIVEFLKAQKPKAKPKTDSAKPVAPLEAQETKDAWYVLKWNNQHGPFTSKNVLRMLQEKSIYEFDYVWKNGLANWTRLAELDQFSEDNVRNMADVQDEVYNDVFFRRRHSRTSFNGTIIVHDHQSVWKGASMEISEGGAGLVIENAMLLPGQKLFIHFKPGDGVPSFNAVCEVVSKKFSKNVKERSSPVRYGVKFLEINGVAKEAIRQFVKTSAA